MPEKREPNVGDAPCCPSAGLYAPLAPIYVSLSLCPKHASKSFFLKG